MAKLQGTQLGNNFYENAREQYSRASSRNFDETMWLNSVRTDTLDDYVVTLREAENKGINRDFIESTYKGDYVSPEDYFHALQTEVFADRTNVDADRTRYVFDENGNVKYDDNNKPVTENYKASDYDYYKDIIKYNIKVGDQQHAVDVEKQRKDEMNGFIKWGWDVVGGASDMFSGLMGAIEDVHTAVKALDAGVNAGKGNFVDGYVNFMGKSEGWDWLESMDKEIFEFERKYSNLRKLDGTYTNYGRIVGGACTSIGEMLPSVALTMAGGAIGGAIGKLGTAGTAAAKAASIAGKAVTKTLVGAGQLSFYGNMNTNYIKQAYQLQVEQGVSINTDLILTNALTKTAFQWGIEKLLPKIMGGSTLDKMVLGRNVRISGGSSLTQAGLKRVGHDFLEEGFEEVLQDISDYIIDSVFNKVYKQEFGEMDLSGRTLLDSFIIGGVVSFAGNAARVLTTRRVGSEKTGLDKKLNKVASHEFNLTQQAFFQAFNDVQKANDAKLIRPTDRATRTALKQMYAAGRLLASLYGAYGNTRFDNAFAVLAAVQKAQKISKLHGRSVAMEQANKIVENLALTQAEYAVDLADRLEKQEAENVLNKFKRDNALPESAADVGETIKQLFDANPDVNTIAVTKKGAAPVKASDTLVVPKNSLAIGAKSVQASITEQALVENVVTGKFDGINKDALIKAFKSFSGEDADYTTVIFNLLYKPEFFDVVLRSSTKDMYTFLQAIVNYANALNVTDKLDAQAKQTVDKCLAVWKPLFINYCVNNPEANIPSFIESDTRKIDGLRWCKNIYTDIATGKKLTKQQETLLRQRINAAPVSMVEKTALYKVFGDDVRERLNAFNKLNLLYNNAFKSDYDGKYYMPDTSLANNTFNAFLKTHNLTLVTMQDEQALSDENVVMYKEGGYTSAFEFWADVFSKWCNKRWAIFYTNGHYGVLQPSDAKQYGFDTLAAATYSETGRDTNQVLFESGTNEDVLFPLLSEEIDDASKSSVTINDAIVNPYMLNDKIRSAIAAKYNGEVSAYTAFLYLKGYIPAVNSDLGILVKSNGSFVFGDIKTAKDVLVSKDIDWKNIKSIKDVIKARYLKGSLADVQVKYASKSTLKKYGASAYYSWFGERNGMVYFENTIYLDKSADSALLQFEFMHEFIHAVQYANRLNVGYTIGSVGKMSSVDRANIIKEFRDHLPALFEGVKKGSKQEVEIVEDFLYTSAGDIGAFGLESTVIMLPTVCSYKDGKGTITLPWGSEYTYDSGADLPSYLMNKYMPDDPIIADYAIRNIDYARESQAVASELYGFTDTAQLCEIEDYENKFPLIEASDRVMGYSEHRMWYDKDSYANMEKCPLNTLGPEEVYKRIGELRGQITISHGGVRRDTITRKTIKNSKQFQDISLQLMYYRICPNMTYEEFLETEIPYTRLQQSPEFYKSTYVSAMLGRFSANAFIGTVINDTGTAGQWINTNPEFISPVSEEDKEAYRDFVFNIAKKSNDYYIVYGKIKPRDTLLFLPNWLNEVLLEPDTISKTGGKIQQLNKNYTSLTYSMFSEEDVKRREKLFKQYESKRKELQTYKQVLHNMKLNVSLLTDILNDAHVYSDDGSSYEYEYETLGYFSMDEAQQDLTLLNEEIEEHQNKIYKLTSEVEKIKSRVNLGHTDDFSNLSEVDNITDFLNGYTERTFADDYSTHFTIFNDRVWFSDNRDGEYVSSNYTEQDEYYVPERDIIDELKQRGTYNDYGLTALQEALELSPDTLIRTEDRNMPTKIGNISEQALYSLKGTFSTEADDVSLDISYKENDAFILYYNCLKLKYIPSDVTFEEFKKSKLEVQFSYYILSTSDDLTSLGIVVAKPGNFSSIQIDTKVLERKKYCVAKVKVEDILAVTDYGYNDGYDDRAIGLDDDGLRVVILPSKLIDAQVLSANEVRNSSKQLEIILQNILDNTGISLATNSHNTWIHFDYENIGAHSRMTGPDAISNELKVVRTNLMADTGIDVEASLSTKVPVIALFVPGSSSHIQVDENDREKYWRFMLLINPSSVEMTNHLCNTDFFNISMFSVNELADVLLTESTTNLEKAKQLGGYRYVVEHTDNPYNETYKIFDMTTDKAVSDSPMGTSLVTDSMSINPSLLRERTDKTGKTLAVTEQSVRISSSGYEITKTTFEDGSTRTTRTKPNSKKGWYIRDELRQNTNLKYFTDKYMDPQTQFFVINGSEDTVDEFLWNKIKKGTFTKRDAVDYLRDNDTMSEDTFKLINDAFYQNDAITSLTQLNDYVDNSAKHYALRVILRNPAMGLSDDFGKDVDIDRANILESLIHKDEKLTTIYFDLIRKFEDADVPAGPLRVRWMQHYTGSILTAGQATAGVKIALEQGWDVVGVVGSGASRSLDATMGDGTSGNRTFGDIVSSKDEDAAALFSEINDDDGYDIRAKMLEILEYQTKQELLRYLISQQNAGKTLSQEEALAKFNELKDEFYGILEELWQNTSYDKMGQLDERLTKKMKSYPFEAIDNLLAQIKFAQITGDTSIIGSAVDMRTVRAPAYAATSIRRAALTIRKNLSPKRQKLFLEENDDLFDKDFTVKRSLYMHEDDTRGAGVWRYNTIAEMNPIKSRVLALSKSVRLGDYNSKAALKAKKNYDARMAEKEAKLTDAINNAKSGTKREKVYTTFRVDDNPFTISTDVPIPKVLDNLLQHHFSKVAKTDVQTVADDNAKHIVTSLKSFIDESASELVKLTQADIDDILNFYKSTYFQPVNVTNESDLRKFKIVQMAMLTYILAQHQQGTDRFTLSEEQENICNNALKYLASEAAQNLANWREALRVLNPEHSLEVALARKYGIQYDGMETDIQDVLLAVGSKNMERVVQARQKLYNHAAEARRGKKRNIFDMLLQWERVAMLSGPGTWIRNQASNIVIKGTNVIAGEIGVAAEKLIMKLFPKSARAKRTEFITQTKQYKIVGTKVSDVIKNFVTTEVLTKNKYDVQEYNVKSKTYESKTINVDVYDLIADGVNRYNPSAKTRLFTTSEALSDILTDAVLSKVTQTIGAKFTSVDKFYSFLYKMLSDNAYIKKSFTKYLGKMMQEDYATDPGVIEYGLSKKVIDIIAEAYTMATTEYMHKGNFISDFEQKLRYDRGAMVYFAYKQVFPFLSASWNWFLEGLNYTPVGLGKAILDFIKLENYAEKLDTDRQQGKKAPSSRFAEYLVTRRIGKGVIGTIGFAIGVILGALGLVKLDAGDDKWKIVVGDTVTIDISGLFGTQGILLGMAMTGSLEDSTVMDIVAASLNQLSIDSGLDNLATSLRWSDGIGDVLVDMPFTMMGMFIPNMLKSLTMFNIYKTQYSSNKAVKKLQQLSMQLLPQLSYVYETQLDPYTGQKQLRYGNSWYESMGVTAWNKLMPIDIYPQNISDLEKEAVSVEVNKAALSGKYTVNGEKVTLSPKDVTKLNKFYGELNFTTLQALFGNKIKYRVLDEKTHKYVELLYKKMTKKQKAAAINGIMTKNSNYAKIYILTENGYTYYTSDKKLEALRKLGIKTRVKPKDETQTDFFK